MQSFNLVDEPWIPCEGGRKASLMEVFSDPSIPGLSGNPLEKVALFKLLLAIAQAAATPKDELEWQKLGAESLAAQCRSYLAQWHSAFDMYGPAPFLQLPAIAAADVQPFGALMPHVAVEGTNATILKHTQLARFLSEGEKALLLVVLMSFALAGKKADNAVVLSSGYQGKANAKGKPSSGKNGPSLGHKGFLHSFVQGETLHKTLYLNLLTEDAIAAKTTYPAGRGTAPWEKMPTGEDDATARSLRSSVMGRLIPLCRFCLLDDEGQGFHYSEGLAHPGYKEGVTDPTMAVSYAGKDPRAVWARTDTRPWREVPALLSFLGQGQKGPQCWLLEIAVPRAIANEEIFKVWSGGLQVSSKAGEHYFSGSDDFVESTISLHSSDVGSIWLTMLQQEMLLIDGLAKSLGDKVRGYHGGFQNQGDEHAERAKEHFWQQTEQHFPAMIEACAAPEGEQRKLLRRKIAGVVMRTYDQACSNISARQMLNWAKNRPNLSEYLSKE